MLKLTFQLVGHFVKYSTFDLIDLLVTCFSLVCQIQTAILLQPLVSFLRRECINVEEIGMRFNFPN